MNLQVGGSKPGADGRILGYSGTDIGNGTTAPKMKGVKGPLEG